MRKLLLIAFMGIAFNSTAQMKIDSLMKNQMQADNININKPDLQNIDLRVLSVLQTYNDFKNIKDKIRNIAMENMRCIDSIDYSEYGKDSLILKIYSQNYAYRGMNSYRLGFNKDSKNDSLYLYHIYYDMKIKSIIEDYNVFMNRKFDFSINGINPDYAKKTKRLLIAKKYL